MNFPAGSRIAPAASSGTDLLAKWRHILLLAMLGLLLLVFWFGPRTELGRAMFVAHFGLFIVWQPFVEGGRRLALPALVLLVVALVGMTAALGPRLLMLWVMLLTALVGGKVMLGEGRRRRPFYLFALAYLVLVLLLLGLPLAFPQVAFPPEMTVATRLILVGLLGLMVLIPFPHEAAPTAEFVDFINSVLVLLVLAVVVLGSLATVLLGGAAYLDALIQTLLLLGGSLMTLGWLWNPQAGFSGLGELVSRHLMSVGLPAEQWLQILADHATRESDPQRFLARAAEDMVRRLPWLRGVRWQLPDGEGLLGHETPEARRFRHLGVSLTLYTPSSLSPTLAWHIQLLTQLLGEFHADKLRSRQLKELSYLQAIHETGARLTHDVKNLLQSMQTLCHVAEQDAGDDPQGLQSLLRRQLPALTGRLATTLSKLQGVVPADDLTLQDGASWWAGVVARYGTDSRFTLACSADALATRIPVDLFWATLENLLANIEEKRAAEPGLKAGIQLSATTNRPVLRVTDDGSPVPSRLMEHLMKGPVESANGLGIGLFQAAKAAASAGYALCLEANQPGEVCFTLRPLASPTPAP